MDVEVGGQEEVNQKLARIRSYLGQSDLAGILLSRQDNFAWLTGGLDNHVVVGAEAGVASLLVTRDDAFVLTNRIEAGRIRDEEIGAQRWEWRAFDWFRPGGEASAIREVVGDGVVGADTHRGGTRTLDASFDDLRADLLPVEVARYREVGRLATEAMVEACGHLHVGHTEWEIAADLARRVTARGGRPGVVLVATDERIDRYRHPIPTQKKVREYAMLVLGASKWGLSISITRFVAFRSLSEELRRKWRDVSALASYFTLATRAGRPWADIFQGATDLYRDLGWENEWQLHHQGGPTGYRGREFTAAFDSPGQVAATQASAWNPSITGTKSEDTIITDSTSHEFLTRHGEWPMLTVDQAGQRLTFPDVLVRQHLMRRYA